MSVECPIDKRDCPRLSCLAPYGPECESAAQLIVGSFESNAVLARIVHYDDSGMIGAEDAVAIQRMKRQIEGVAKRLGLDRSQFETYVRIILEEDLQP